MEKTPLKATYVCPQLEQCGVFSTVTGISIPIGAVGNQDWNDLMDLNGSDLLEGAKQ